MIVNRQPEEPQHQRNQYIAENTSVEYAYNFVADITSLSSFVQPLLLPKCAKSRDIPRKFELIAVQGHPRSSILVPIEST